MGKKKPRRDQNPPPNIPGMPGFTPREVDSPPVGSARQSSAESTRQSSAGSTRQTSAEAPRQPSDQTDTPRQKLADSRQSPRTPPESQPPKASTQPAAGQRSPDVGQGDARRKPASQSKPSAEELAKMVENMKLLPVPSSKYGTRGRKIMLESNYLKILLNLKQIFHYDVTISRVTKRSDGREPRELPRAFKCIIISQLRQDLPALFAGGNTPAYDGEANLYTAKRLPIPNDCSDYQVTVKNGKTEDFSVALQLVNLLDVSRMDMNQPPQTLITAMDIVFRQAGMNKPSVAQIGRNLFDPDDVEDLGGGRNMWRGRHQSVRNCEWAPLTLNVDVTASTFYKEQNLIDFTREFLGLRPQDENRPFRPTNVIKLEKELRSVKIVAEYGERVMKRPIQGITEKGAATLSFDNDGKTETVEKYFLRRYGIQLQFRYFPCVQLGKGQCYIPMEVCRIAPKQRGKKTMGENQTRIMVRNLAEPPANRKQSIQKQIRKANYAADPYLRSFGITVGESMMTLEGRVLEPPPIIYSGQAQSKPFAGAWNSRGLKFYSCFSENDKWALLNFDQYLRDDDAQNFHKKLVEIAQSLGMSWKSAAYTGHEQYDNVGKRFKSLLENKINMVVCVIGDKDQNYGLLKHQANVVHGIMTQCVTARTAKKAGPQDVANVCLKINAKLGGTNFVPRDPFVRKNVMNVPTIIIGADVTHPDSHDPNRPSIAGAVSSYDIDAVKYHAEVRVQQRRAEPILALEELIRSQLLNFYIKSGKRFKPEKIIYYRDGVGESQFVELLTTELCAIRNACKALEASYQPRITFILVQKKHHTRFFPQNPQKDGEGKHKNVPAGTIADRTVTDQKYYNFYLSSHAAIQGTSRPGHYYVLCDDSRHSMDDLQALTFYLSHVYSNCTRSVSSPTPAYYAHKVATMAKHHLDSLYPMGGFGPACDEGGNPTPAMNRAIEIHPNVRDKMYFL